MVSYIKTFFFSHFWKFIAYTLRCCHKFLVLDETLNYQRSPKQDLEMIEQYILVFGGLIPRMLAFLYWHVKSDHSVHVHEQDISYWRSWCFFFFFYHWLFSTPGYIYLNTNKCWCLLSCLSELAYSVAQLTPSHMVGWELMSITVMWDW